MSHILFPPISPNPHALSKLWSYFSKRITTTLQQSSWSSRSDLTTIFRLWILSPLISSQVVSATFRIHGLEAHQRSLISYHFGQIYPLWATHLGNQRCSSCELLHKRWWQRPGIIQKERRVGLNNKLRNLWNHWNLRRAV